MIRLAHEGENSPRHYLASVLCAGNEDFGAIIGKDIVGTRARIFHPYYAKSRDMGAEIWTNRAMSENLRDPPHPEAKDPMMEDWMNSLQFSGASVFANGVHLTQVISWVYRVVNYFNENE